MTGKHKFFRCEHCGNMIGLIADKGVPLVCCGEEMAELVPNTVEAATEKHLPEVTKTECGIKVQVGSVVHPMEEAHYITFIYVQTENGGQRKILKPGMEPKHEFCFVDYKPIAVYEHCNLHGLWMTEL